MTAELQLVFVAPQYFWLVAVGRELAEDVVEVEDLVSGSIADQHQHRALV